jgi:hypothetical protein
MSFFKPFRQSTFAAIGAALLFATSSVKADVPPPVGPAPSDGGGGSVSAPSPSDLGSSAPSTPPGIGDLPPIPPPSNRASNPEHPDPSVGNYPSDSWYQDMYDQIYDSSDYYSQLEDWAYQQYYQTGYVEIWNVYIYASYLRVYLNQYYWNSYGSSGSPLSFSWGHASRGDFNYGYFFYIRPVYQKLIEASGDYYSNYHTRSDFDARQYSGHMKPAMVQYHRFTRCNFGKNGLDRQAKDDDALLPAERAAGVSLTASDIIP